MGAPSAPADEVEEDAEDVRAGSAEQGRDESLDLVPVGGEGHLALRVELRQRDAVARPDERARVGVGDGEPVALEARR